MDFNPDCDRVNVVARMLLVFSPPSPVVKACNMVILNDHFSRPMTAHSRVIGLEKWSFKMTLLQAFTTVDGGENTNSILASTFTRSQAGLKSMMTVSAFGGTSTVSASNPTWSGLVVLKNYSPILGGVGDLLKTDVEFLGSGNLTEAYTT